MNEHSVNTAADIEEIVGDLAERYAEELRAGRQPDLEAYIREYPEAADAIRQILPTLEIMASVASEENLQSSEVELQSSQRDLGDFRIIREIGRGGMGVVYEAEQLSIGRRVALKVLPFASVLDRQQLNRFKNEARAAGTLDHPNIVAVYSVGVERGVHYYAMQLIEGQSLAQVVEQLRQKSVVSSPSSVEQKQTPTDNGPRTTDTAPIAHHTTLPDFSSKEYFRAIAQLGIQAAEALDHAHQNGILHRDIKPANLLVDDTGKLWITDFGLARMEQDAGMTMTGDILGTLRYMSPEQALAKRVVVDHRSDIYSLGVTLYELLTLQPVFQGEDRQELLRQIAFDDPRPLRQTNGRIPQDLETIVQKTIEKNPAHRYGTANDLANDLRNFIGHQPIKARRHTWRDKIVKWSRRHPAGVRAGLISVLVSIVVLSSSVGWILHDRAARQAIVSKQIDLALDEAETWYWAGKVTNALSAIKHAERILDGSNESDFLAQSVKQRRLDLETVQRLEQFRSDRAGIETDSSFADQEYREIFRSYGIDFDSLKIDEVSKRISRSPIRNELVAALDDWSMAGASDGTAETDGAPIDERVLQIAQQVDPHPWRDRLRNAIRRGDESMLMKLAEEDEAAEQPPAATILLARALESRKRFEEAVRLLEIVQRRHPTDFWINIELATCLRSLVPPKTQEAIGYRRVAVALRPDSALAYNHLALALYVQGDVRGAEAACRESIRINPNFVMSYYNLVNLLWGQGKRTEAEAVFRDAPRPKPEKHRDYSSYAGCLALLGKTAEAETAFRSLIQRVPKHVSAQVNLGQLLVQQGKYSEAESYCREAVRLRPSNASTHVVLGKALVGLNKLDEAEAAFREAIRMEPANSAALEYLVRLLARQGRYSEAESHCREGVRLNPNSAANHGILGWVMRGMNKLDEAEEAFREAIRIESSNVVARLELSDVLAGQGKFEEAVAQYDQVLMVSPENFHAANGLSWLLATAPADGIRDGKRALELATRANEMTEFKDAGVVDTLAAAYAELGDFESAVKWANKAIELEANEANRDELSKHLAEFQQKRPWREPNPETAHQPEQQNSKPED
jgi:serine/threonine protein kinase/Flp pilus assembly protein TadD